MPPKKPVGGPSKVPADTAITSVGTGKGKGKAKTTDSPTASQGKGKGAASSSKATTEDANAPKVPSAREIIGGTSWTGKLPQTLFYELTVREKWEKPDYTMNRTRNGYVSTVIVKNTNPKTKEKEEIRFNPPGDVETLPRDFSSALEARHYAATYALFRVSSSKNVHLMLPPTYRDYWRDFNEIKKKDVSDGKSWKYNADPFLTKREFEAADAERAKSRAKKEDASSSSSTSASLPPKGWDRVPSVDMGQRARQEVEKLVRSHHVWTLPKASMDKTAISQVIANLHSMGFRRSHAEEACEWTRNREEALEWLLIHVPEDDLPQRFLPDNYTAGAFAFIPESLSQEYAAKRLAVAGYSIELTREALAMHANDEYRAAESLMQMLLSNREQLPLIAEEDLLSFDDFGSGDNPWSEEQKSLGAIYGDRFRALDLKTCHIELDVKKAFLPKKITLEIRKPTESYPEHIPTIALLTEPLLPAHVRLSIIKQTAEFAYGQRGQAMIYDLMDWLENNLECIVERPGKLRNVTAGVPATEISDATEQHRKKTTQRRKPINWTAGLQESLKLLGLNERRLESKEQQKMLKVRQSLPAWKLKDDIVTAINKCQVVIISGETGSGKSTQSVQFVLDDLIHRELGSAAKILCTQPRRISALGLADRVTAERCGAIGDEVGYAIRGETKVRHDTKITFMTTGVLLRRLQSGDTLEDVSHVFVDEVHERSLDTDFLLVLLKRILPTRKDFKVVLMSATLDAEMFSSFFGGAAMIHIEGRTFPVNDFYLDDVIKATNFDAHQGPARRADEETEGMDPSVGAAIRALGDRINYDLIAETVDFIDKGLNNLDGAILIFLPGTMEISRAISAIRALPHSSRFHALPLHASLMPAEQKLVFPKPPHGKRKIICATNVAETSITIEDVVSVIDTGRVKETTYDAETSMVRLAEVWASRAACKQRRGRAGRVRIGNCYKLYTRHAESNKMQERPDPEILRIPLENLCLSVKAMGVRNVRSFLASALTPPNATAVEEALTTLRKIGAIDEEELTGLGRHLSMIPADLRCAKLMIYGAMFGCVNAALTIASVLTARSPFNSPIDKREESKAARQNFAKGNGDVLADCRAYEEWLNRRKTSSSAEVRRWCDLNFLSYNTLNDITSNISQYISALQEIAFLPFNYRVSSNDHSLHSFNSQNNNDTIIRAIVAGAFNPQIARIGMPEKKYASTMSGAKELDPEARTIKYYTNENGRVFLHPSATLFDAQSFVGNSTFMAFASKIATAKLYIRDVTPINSYSLLLFGGQLELDIQGRGLVIDGWLRIRGYPRIGCLINRLRAMLDEALEAKVEDPTVDLQANEVVRCVRKLVERDGMDAP